MVPNRARGARGASYEADVSDASFGPWPPLGPRLTASAVGLSREPSCIGLLALPWSHRRMLELGVSVGAVEGVE